MQHRELVSREAENGVIGALLHKPDLCEEIGAFLQASSFVLGDHAVVYNLILADRAKGINSDPITLSQHCERLPSGESTIAFVSEIMFNVPSAANGVHYARIVVERSMARRLYAVAQRIMVLAESQGAIPAQISEAQQALFEFNIEDETPDVMTYRDVLSGVIGGIDRRYVGTISNGLEFGFPDLDNILKGLRPANLVIVAAKPGVGKTVLGTNLADKIATKDGKSALIFSLEMASAELVGRALAATGSVSKTWIDEGGKSSDEFWPMLTRAVQVLDSADVRFCDKGNLTFSRLCNIARFQHRAKKLHLIVIDYLTLIRPDKESKFGTRSQEVGAFSRGLKALAKELNIPVVVLAQLNRASDGRAAADSKPRLSDLRDSGEIEQDADIVILGHRADDASGRSGITSWNVAKVRHAKPGECNLQFQGDYQRFVSCAASDAYSYERDIAPVARGLRSYVKDVKPGFDD